MKSFAYMHTIHTLYTVFPKLRTQSYAWAVAIVGAWRLCWQHQQYTIGKFPAEQQRGVPGQGETRGQLGEQRTAWGWWWFRPGRGAGTAAEDAAKSYPSPSPKKPHMGFSNLHQLWNWCRS